MGHQIQKHEFDGCYKRSFMMHSSAGYCGRAQVRGQTVLDKVLFKLQAWFEMVFTAMH